jgi:hypothetical protein
MWALFFSLNDSWPHRFETVEPANEASVPQDNDQDGLPPITRGNTTGHRLWAKEPLSKAPR